MESSKIEENKKEEISIKTEKLCRIFNITSKKISKEKLQKIADKIYNTEEKEKEKVLSEIQNNFKSKNEIKVPDLLKFVKSNKNNEIIKELEIRLNKLLNPNMEDIVEIMKKLKEKKWIKLSTQYSSSLDEIISMTSKKNLNEIYDTKISKNTANKHLLGILEIYTDIREKNVKFTDINTSRVSKVRFKTTKYIENMPNNHNNFLKRFIEAYNTKNINSLCYMISPSIIAKISNEISKLDQCDFNIFEFDNLLGKKASVYIAQEIINRLDYYKYGTINKNKLEKFLNEIVEHYDRVNALYHNDLHACDVMQTLYTILIKGKIEEKLKLIPLDIFSILIAAFCHDYKHTGQNNLYHINTKSKIATRYNGILFTINIYRYICS